MQERAMGDLTVRVAMVLLLLLMAIFASSTAGEEQFRREWGEEEEEEEGKPMFILEKGEKVVKTDGGEVRVVRGRRWKGHPDSPIHIAFISMEPNTLFIPQYIDANLILFVRRGEAKVGWIHKDDLVEKQLKMGDVNRIPAGSAFYMVNTGKGQRLQIICSVDTNDRNGYSAAASPDWDLPPYRSFFIGGGLYPKSVLAGFDIRTLTTAFNATEEQLSAITSGRSTGPIIYITGEAADQPHRLSSMMLSQLSQAKKKLHAGDEDDDEENEASHRKPSDHQDQWTWRKLLTSILGETNQEAENRKKIATVRAPDSYNLFDREPDFKNRYGWSVAVDEHDYKPLCDSDVGVYLVNLTAGSMLAPHVNPRAAEYGVVLGGSGTVQVVFPNGTSAMKAEVGEGDVFWVPRFFPFCQVASRGGPLEFFGFTTSARRNRPQFLAGARSVLRSMSGPELAAGLGISREELDTLVASQEESVILPSWPAREERRGRREKKGEDPPLILQRTA